MADLKRTSDVTRATMLAISDVSNINEFTLESSITDSHPISMDHNRRIINDIIDSPFNEQKGICEVSSSECSSLYLKPSQYNYDQRLKYWKNVLKEREKLSAKILKTTNKNHADILYNRLTSLDERDKNTVKRLLDLAQRLNPIKLLNRQPVVLQEKCNVKTKTIIPEVQETLPLSERCQNAKIEIIGLPKVGQREILGKSKWQGSKKPFSWLESKHLESRIEKSREDIERVLEFYPDIEHLQVVGESLLGTKVRKHNSEIEVMPCKDICSISTDTISGKNECFKVTANKSGPELHDYAFKINEQEFIITNRRCYRNLKTLTNFSCFPFQTEVKKILTLQNIGKKVLTFEWLHSSFYDKTSTLLKCSDNEFVFDNVPFRLCSGEVQEVIVIFQPRRVSVVKSKWVLKVKPSLYKQRMDTIAMSLSGVCLVPPEYNKKLDELQRDVIAKSNKKMMKMITKTLGILAADMEPYEYPCPYQRVLSEMELFEQLNVGFKCERHNDLELLKELYKRTKKPRDKTWDLQISTLKRNIFKMPNATDRSSCFNELCEILNTMRGNSIDLETKIQDSSETYRCRLLYVRGIISTAIEEWVDMVLTLEDTFYQTTLQVINEELGTQPIEDVEEEAFGFPEGEDEKREHIVESRVRKLKPFRDILYMQTYTLLCDFVENIVSVIESTV